MKQPTVTIETVEFKVIYIRFTGTYQDFRKNAMKLFNQLFTYAKKHQLIEEGITKVITMYHDNPFITKPKQLRTSVAMTVSSNVNVVDDEISVMTISGRFGVGHFNINRMEYDQAWQHMYHEWLFKSDETPRDAIPFEMYITEPPRNAKDESFTDIYIPIE